MDLLTNIHWYIKYLMEKVYNDYNKNQKNIAGEETSNIKIFTG